MIGFLRARVACTAVAAAAAAALLASGPGAATAQPLAAPAIAANPTVELVDGIIRGNLNVSGTGSQALRFEVLSSSRGGKLAMGTVESGSPAATAQSFTILPYANWLDGDPRGRETFVVRVTPVAKAGAAKSGPAAAPLDVTISVNVGALAPGATPVAFTYKVVGYAGTPISTNFFPASGLAEGSTAPTILDAPGLGSPGSTDPYQAFDTQTHTPGIAALRGDSLVGGFNVITWDPRGEFASGGTLQLNDPFLDGVDATNIVTWAAESTPATLNGWLDPAVGMTGGSSGGEIQLVTASIDPRIDAIVPSTTWNSLIDSLYANATVNIPVATRLLSAVTKPGVRLSPALRAGLENGIASGRLSDATLTQLADKNASTLLSQMQAPTLLWQNTADPLFSLNESMDTAVSILANPYGTPVKVAWFDGSAEDAAVTEMVSDYTLSWLSKYVKGTPIPDSYTPTFQWWDQTGTRYTSPLFPFDPGFNSPDVISAASSGGTLPVGASCSKPASGLKVQASVPEGAQIVGVPTLTVSYRGRGKGQALCVRVTDASTGKVVSSPVTMLPLVLDGKRRTSTVELNGLAFTGLANSRLVVTVWGIPRSGVRPASLDATVSELEVSLPRRAS